MHRHLTEMAVDAGPEFFRDEAGAPAPWPWRRCPVCVEDIISDLVASPSQDGSSQAYLPMAGEAWQQSWRPRKRQKGVKTCQYCSRKISECFARQMQPTLERRQNELVETAVRNGFGDDAVTDNEIRQDLTELAVDSGPRFFQNESGQSAPWPWRHVPICVEELIDGLVANRREPSDTQEASSEGLAGTDNP